MQEKDVYGIVLAAGKGTRMKSKLYKVLHPVCGKAMVLHVMDSLEEAGVSHLVTVVGHGSDAVKDLLADRTDYCFQEEQLGTAHAVKMAKDLLADKEGKTIVICGDTPLIRPETLKALLAHHDETLAKATILTSLEENPTGYGRIIRDEEGSVQKIVEEKDATDEERLVKEVNSGTYVFDNRSLFKALEEVKNDNAQGEYYLPDVVAILKSWGEVVSAYPMEDVREGLGVNDRLALSKATRFMQERINQEHMLNGVTMIDPTTTFIDAGVKIGADTLIEGQVTIKGQTVIGEDCTITSGSRLIDATIGNGVTVTQSVIESARMADGSNIGPFGRLRPQADIGENVHIGNFVEVKKATIKKDSKVGHLTYIGDATVGERVNVGCGTIFVNYNGKDKFHTTVGDDCFIGCDTSLVAPVNLGDGAFTAAGSVITKDVPADGLAIARNRQSNKENYAKKLPHRR
ncbi:bifunctional UDP-N-acetylglucosamine diphosphorylase/glucosamine-1-phosphate N-acetyltransferase GlmU [Atopobacter sp. AH10]|nr:bifunctional UDP-N-acetylglucosamine diphosphorylase/glucosamine-1-phosphate N-acetyltransferase GlmU [Atopobacter sp. AH10]RLK63627.1 bifunctional UDP-N-acetylglucosamine diphosphorylase/glucosamine-1-phosphate N-acetyltransferase GlmU [Atopobacter sp. AH10]